MGNRALIQLTDGSHVSPALYVHWLGDEVEDIIRRAESLMGGGNDIEYGFARLVQAACEYAPESGSGVGVWNLAERATGDDSPGDNGVILVYTCGVQWRIFRLDDGYTEEELDELIRPTPL